MNKFIPALILSLSILGPPALADIDHDSFLKLAVDIQEELKCEANFNFLNKAYKVRKNDFVDCEDAYWADNAIKKVSLISTTVPKVSIELMSRDSAAFFDIGSIVRMPLHLTFSNHWGQVFNSLNLGTDAILYHEYSHAIFGEVIGKKFYPGFKAQAESLSRYKMALQDAYATGNYGNKADYYEKQIKRLQAQMKEHKEIDRYHLSSSYNEFFADLVAVLVTNNPNAILSALYYDEMSDQSYQMIKLRSFEDQGTNYDNNLLSEIHGELAIARQFVGENILKEIFKIKDEDHAQHMKKEVLDKVLLAIEKQMDKRIKTNDYGISPRKNNESLIAEIKEIFNL